MDFLWIGLGVMAFLTAVFFLTAYICFRMAFYAPDRTPEKTEVFDLPEDNIYGPYRGTIQRWAEETKAMPYQAFTITSYDGLQLYGQYYEYKKGAPIELMFHGYRGNTQRDLAGGVQRCFQLGHNALLVDQRCGQCSQGNVITFGVREHRDCLHWIEFILNHFGSDVQIILTGISMGASTVLIAASNPLPNNVIGVLADCGYTNAKDIIKRVIRHLKLPVGPAYFFVRIGARLYGRFDPEEIAADTALKNCTLPVIFIHGLEDHFVPCEMSRINYEACSGPKKLVTIPGAGHGMSYPVDPQKYLQELQDFFWPLENKK